MRLIPFGLIFLMASIGYGFTQPSTAVSCIDLKQVQPFRFEGVLTRGIFPGPPNCENVHKGDKPEPAYILRLRKPICVMGGAFVDSSRPIDRIQVFPADADTDGQSLSKDLRRLVGRSVTVEGREPFGAHTGHHHAPLLLPIANISIASDR